MQIQLPHAAEIGAALLGWRATNPAVDPQCASATRSRTTLCGILAFRF